MSGESQAITLPIPIHSERTLVRETPYVSAPSYEDQIQQRPCIWMFNIPLVRDHLSTKTTFCCILDGPAVYVWWVDVIDGSRWTA